MNSRAPDPIALRPEVAWSRERASRLDGLRIGAAGLVVFIHSSAAPGALAADAGAPIGRALAGAAFRVASSLAVPTFLMLAFMQLAPTGGARFDFRRIRQRCARIVPAYLFWTLVYAGLKFASGQARLSPSTVAEYLLLGKSAAHMYFLPLLLLLTALAPLWLVIARRPLVAAIAAIVLPIGSSYLVTIPGLGIWTQSLLGVAGNAVYPIVGIGLSQGWFGGEPPPERRRVAFTFCLGVSLAATVLVAAHGAVEGLGSAAMPLAFVTRIAWVAAPIATVGAVVSSRATVPAWAAPVARLTFGIYLVHPLVVVPLRLLEARVGGFASQDPRLVLPNALFAFAIAALFVFFSLNTRLRRVLA